MSGGPLLWNAVEVEMLGLALGVYLLFNIGLVHDHVRLVLAHIGWSVLLVGKVRLIMNNFIILSLSYLVLNLLSWDLLVLVYILQHSWDLTMLAQDLSPDHLLIINELHALGHLHVWVSTDNICKLVELLLHLLLLRRFRLPEQSVRNVRLLLGLGLGHGDAVEDVLVNGELIFGPCKWIFLVRGLVEAGVRFVEVRMLRLEHMEHAGKPEQVSLLPPQMFDQIVTRLSAGHLLHYTDELPLHLSLAGRLRDLDGSNLSHVRHVNFTGQNLVQKLNGDYLRVLGRQEPLLPEHEFVERVKVRKESVDGILEGHFLND